jgi:hypothetical protein
MLGWSSSCYAIFGAIWDYVRQYQLGLEYSQSTDGLRLSYRTDYQGSYPIQCTRVLDEPAEQVCTQDIVAGQSSGLGLFLQSAFKRQGDFYFSMDLNLSARYLNGEIDETEQATLEAQGLPLTQASFELASLVVLPYVKLGYTPTSSFPDLLLSFGPALQAAVGQATLNGERRDVAVALASRAVGYVEFEAVLWRFGDGALSLYASEASTGGESTPFFPEVFDDIRQVRASTRSQTSGDVLGYGVKLLLNWP